MLLATAALPSWAITVYVYERSDGSRLVTDRERWDDGLRLIKTYRSGESGAGPDLPAVRDVVAGFVERRSEYDRLIRKAAILYGVDGALVKAMVHAESSFDPYAVSRKGAYGLMQLMPATARRYRVANPIDPVENVIGGVRYLRDLLKRFDNDSTLAVAAYNAGENAVERYDGIPPYTETRNYVKKVMRLRRLYASR